MITNILRKPKKMNRTPQKRDVGKVYNQLHYLASINCRHVSLKALITLCLPCWVEKLVGFFRRSDVFKGPIERDIIDAFDCSRDNEWERESYKLH